jgi:4,5-dihydroxyphthalate decarboxylase
LTTTIEASIARYPHAEELLGASVALADGAVVRIREAKHDVTLKESASLDVWEMPVVRYIAARELGFEIRAIPVFTTRRFIQWMVEVSANSTISSPQDLLDKRLVVHNYGNTDTIWARGVLADSYGVDFSGASWFTLHQEMLPGLVAPAGVTMLEGADRDQLLLDGVIDAAITSGHGNEPRPGLRRLWDDPEREAAEWHQSAGFFPMLHVLVIRTSTLSANPSLGEELTRLFAKTKDAALARWDNGASLTEERQATALWCGFPGSRWRGADRSFLGRDPLPYGLAANRAGLERIIRYSSELGATQRLHAVEELFADVEV